MSKELSKPSRRSFRAPPGRTESRGILLSTRKRIFQAAFVDASQRPIQDPWVHPRADIRDVFGATGEIDAKVAAEKITSVIAVLSGPVSTTFLPVFASSSPKEHDECAKRTTSSIITL